MVRKVKRVNAIENCSRKTIEKIKKKRILISCSEKVGCLFQSTTRSSKRK